MKKFWCAASAYLLVFLLMLSSLSYAQSVSVSGKITDKNAAPLSGATVSVKGSTASVVTNQDGVFQITVQYAN